MSERIEFPRCPNCDMNYPPWLEDDPERCRCARASTRGKEILRFLDPRERAVLSGIKPTSEKEGKMLSAAKLTARGQRKRGLGLLGDPGVGKTHLMIAMYREALDLGLVATWRNVADLVREIQDSYSASKDNQALKSFEIIEAVTVNNIVFLDDLGKEKSTQDVEQLIYQLIDGLYKGRRTLVFSSNLSGPELKERYDPATLSRIQHMAIIVALEGKDRRKEAAYE